MDALNPAEGDALIVPLRMPDFAGLNPAADLGIRPDFAWLPIDRLRVDRRYQRAAGDKRSNARIRKIVDTFAWAKFKPLTVTPYGLAATPHDGLFLVIDGQHGAIAAALHPEVEAVPCWIVGTPTLVDQARAFVAINADKTNLTRMQIFKAALAARDPDALRVEKVCMAAGIRPAINSPAGRCPPLVTTAVSTLHQVIAAYGETVVERALAMLGVAYETVPDQLRAEAIRALCAIVSRHGTGAHAKLERDRLIGILRQLDMPKSIEQARAFREAFGGKIDRGLESIIVEAYNKGLVAARRLSPGKAV